MKLSGMHQHQRAVCMRTNLLEKILVCILFPNEKGHTRISQNFPGRLNLRDVVYSAETECCNMEVARKKEIQSVGHQQSILNWSWKAAPLPGQEGERRWGRQRVSVNTDQNQNIAIKFCSIIRADPFPQLWKTVLVLFISSMGTSFTMLEEEENHCKWHGTAWSFG